MENSLEFQRRQLWIDHMRDQWNRGFKGDSCLESCDVLLAEFDKRFPQPTQTRMMNEDEFKAAMYKKYFDSCQSAEEFYFGASAAYKLLTGKE